MSGNETQFPWSFSLWSRESRYRGSISNRRLVLISNCQRYQHCCDINYCFGSSTDILLAFCVGYDMRLKKQLSIKHRHDWFHRWRKIVVCLLKYSPFFWEIMEIFTSKNSSRAICAISVTLFRINMILLTLMYLKSMVLPLILVTVYSSEEWIFLIGAIPLWCNDIVVFITV